MSKKHRHEEHEEHADESWLLPYSDLMTLLLALFIVLFAASAVNTSKLEALQDAFNSAFTSGIGILDQSASIQSHNQLSKHTKELPGEEGIRTETQDKDKLAKQEQANLEKLQQALNKYIKQNGLSSQLQTDLNQSQLLITIRDNALFASGSADVKQDAQKLAVAIGQMLQGYPDYEIIVSGHTDNKPINTPQFASNWELSSKRAINFMKILLQNPAFDPKNFSAIGYGEYRPAESNATEAGRAKNRRVEVSILRKYTDSGSDNTVLSAIAEDGKTAAVNP